MSSLSKGAVHRREAPAKINLGLHVLRRRADGFHEIETVLLPIGWHDVLTAHEADAFRFTCSDPTLPTGERNLVVRAARAFERLAQREARVALHLEKRLPHGAGLGGGSSDAARTLLLMRDLFAPDLSLRDLHPLAAALGSDIPFFLHDTPMLATGRGEVLAPLGDYDFPFALAVVMPPVQIATAEAYALIQPNAQRRPDLQTVVESNDLDRWRHELTNDFEAPILARYPAIGRAKQDLLDAGAGYAALSGSGAAVFGVFERKLDAERAVLSAEAAGFPVWTSAR